jgi:hypothetical protein
LCRSLDCADSSDSRRRRVYNSQCERCPPVMRLLLTREQEQLQYFITVTCSIRQPHTFNSQVIMSHGLRTQQSIPTRDPKCDGSCAFSHCNGQTFQRPGQLDAHKKGCCHLCNAYLGIRVPQNQKNHLARHFKSEEGRIKISCIHCVKVKFWAYDQKTNHQNPRLDLCPGPSSQTSDKKDTPRPGPVPSVHTPEPGASSSEHEKSPSVSVSSS